MILAYNDLPDAIISIRTKLLILSIQNYAISVTLYSTPFDVHFIHHVHGWHPTQVFRTIRLEVHRCSRWDFRLVVKFIALFFAIMKDTLKNPQVPSKPASFYQNFS